MHEQEQELFSGTDFPPVDTGKLLFVGDDLSTKIRDYEGLEQEVRGYAFFVRDIFDAGRNTYDLCAAIQGVTQAEHLLQNQMSLDEVLMARALPRSDVRVVPFHKQHGDDIKPENRLALGELYKETHGRINTGMIWYSVAGKTKAGILVVERDPSGMLTTPVEPHCIDDGSKISLDQLSPKQFDRYSTVREEVAEWFS